MQDHRRERPTSSYDIDYSDKFRKFSEAVIDQDKDIDSIELDLNRNSSVGSKNGAAKSAQVNRFVAIFLTVVKRCGMFPNA